MMTNPYPSAPSNTEDRLEYTVICEKVTEGTVQPGDVIQFKNGQVDAAAGLIGYLIEGLAVSGSTVFRPIPRKS